MAHAWTTQHPAQDSRSSFTWPLILSCLLIRHKSTSASRHEINIRIEHIDASKPVHSRSDRVVTCTIYSFGWYTNELMKVYKLILFQPISDTRLHYLKQWIAPEKYTVPLSFVYFYVRLSFTNVVLCVLYMSSGLFRPKHGVNNNNKSNHNDNMIKDFIINALFYEEANLTTVNLSKRTNRKTHVNTKRNTIKQL